MFWPPIAEHPANGVDDSCVELADGVIRPCQPTAWRAGFMNSGRASRADPARNTVKGADDFGLRHEWGVSIEQTCNFAHRSIAIYEHHQASDIAADLKGYRAGLRRDRGRFDLTFGAASGRP